MPDLCVEGGRVNHSWCIGIVGHSHGMLDEAGMEMVVGEHVGQSQQVWSHVGICRCTSRVRDEESDDARSHRLPGAQLLVWLSQNFSIFWGRPLHVTPHEGVGLLSM